ncbi:hypothetical protein SBA2_80037 [Acidobacteriia bacterium SbA2]|nr:hypothetical protein SBA2_80037 [Acidobacteriia bacterium SbA2]
MLNLKCYFLSLQLEADIKWLSYAVSRREFVEELSPRSGRQRVAHGARTGEKIDACHPERSEGSRQFLMVQRFTNNCRDPSRRSG